MSSDKLFRLVKSMTKAEKRYFYRLAHQNGGATPNYWKLFAVIDRMTGWDNSQLMEMLHGEAFRRHLPVVKHQLYERILDALHLFYRESEVEEQIKRSTHQAYLLLKRGLLEEAGRRVEQSRKQIEDCNLWHLLPECQEIERLILERSYKAGQQTKSMNSWQEEYRQTLRQIEQSLSVASFRGELSQLHLTKVRPSPESIKHLRKKLSELTPGDNPNSQADFLQSQALLAFMAREADQARQANARLLSTLEQMPPTQRTVSERYLSTLYNYMIDQLQLNNEAALQEGLHKLRSLSGQKGFRQIKNLEAKIFEWSYQLELNALAGKKAYSQMVEKLSEVEQGLQKFSEKLSKPALAGLRHLSGLAAFHSTNPQQALDFLTPLYQERKPAAAEEIYHYAQLLYLLCHYELGHYQLLDHLLVNLSRQLKQRPQTREEDYQVLSAIRQLMRAKDNAERQGLFKDWLQSLPPPPSPLDTYLDLRHWILGKLPSN